MKRTLSDWTRNHAGAGLTVLGAGGLVTGLVAGTAVDEDTVRGTAIVWFLGVGALRQAF